MADGGRRPSERSSSWQRRLTGPVDALAAVVVAAGAAVAASVVAGVTTPTLLLAAQGMPAHWTAATAAIAVLAFVRRRWASAGAATVVAVAFLALCLPSAIGDAPPAWAADAPTFRLYAANLRFDNDRADEAIAAVLDADADVVVLNEVVPPHIDLLTSAGAFERYPAHKYWIEPDRLGQLVMSRLPDSDTHGAELGRGRRSQAVRIDVGGTVVEVWSVHLQSPSTTQWRAEELERGFADLRRAATATLDDHPDRALVLAGDFNASSWNRPFQELLETGFTDAHDAVGRGLSRSWAPVELRGIGGPLLRLDHAVFSHGVWPTEVQDLDLPGSDHRSFLVTFAVRPLAA